MNSGSSTAPSIQYFAFDKSTGRIVHTHSRFSVELDDYAEIPDDELRKMLSLDSSILENLTDRNAANLGFMKIGQRESGALKGPVMVDVTHGTLVAQPRLALSADKRELQGDGKDSATITLAVVSADGKPMHHFKGKIRLTTTRGKLSARGGVLDLKDGTATVTLTSVAETVRNVRVQATVTDALCAGGSVTFEFV